MTNRTIEVPVDLIKAGDIEEIQDLLSKPVLFGRWATHPEHGRVLVVSPGPDGEKEVLVHYECDGNVYGRWVKVEKLTLDPLELTTEEDFENAPHGTIVNTVNDYPVEKEGSLWSNPLGKRDSSYMENFGPWQVVRWGLGE